MVIQINNFFAPISPTTTRRHKPLLNTFPVLSGTNPSILTTDRFDYRRFWSEFRRSPELMSPIWIMISDIMGDRPHWVTNDGKDRPLGRNILNKANQFWIQNRGKETFKACLFDMFITGDGYIWKSPATNAPEVVKEVCDKFKYVLTESQLNRLKIKSMQDEDIKRIRKVDYAASTTMTINSDNHDILSYTQMSCGQTIHFKPDEIVHIRLMTVDGKVYGFSPVEALAAEIALLWLVKGNMIAVMENGGSPDYAVVMENEIAGGPNHQYMVEQLTKYKAVRQRHGALVLTGKVNFEQIGTEVKDMEFKELALYITSQIAYAFGMPVTRIPYLVGSAASKGDSGGLAESGYWKKIADIQDSIEDIFNNQLFGPLGWWIRFPRGYMQDEVREAQTLSMNADTITKAQTIYREYKKKPNLKKINSILNFDEDDLEDMTEDELMTDLERTGMMNQNMLDSQSVQKEPDNRKRADTKRNVANSSANKGLNV